MKITRPIAGATAVALLLAACGGGGDDDAADTTVTTAAETTTTAGTTTTTERATTTSSSSSSTSTTSTTVPAVPRQPLTGEPLDSEDDINPRPALAVKINNHASSRRNLTGIGAADIVFEEIVEGGITRFAAVFHSKDANPVGPIRSGRTQDVNILVAFNEPLFAWSGGNPGVTRIIADSPLTDLNPFRGHGSAYYRGPGSAPHNFYSTTDALWAMTPFGHPGPPPQQFLYLDEGEEFEGEPTAGVDLDVGNVDVQWHWNPETGAFGRVQEGSEHIDQQNGLITATNVVVMGVEYRPSQVDARSPEAQTIGSGPVYVLSDGKYIEGRWQREVSLFPFEFVDLDGNPIKLTPGNTWVELTAAVPTADLSDVTVPAEIWPAP